MKRKLLAWILCVVMMVMTIPMTTFAQTESGVAQASSWEEFMSALADEKVETISLIGEITSPQGKGDDAILLSRSVTILGNGNTMSLNAGGLILGGDVTFENITLQFNNVVRNAIIANGYTLTMSDVKNGSGTTSIHVFAGGITDYNGDNASELPQSGIHGHIVVQGNCQLGNLYAGSLSDGAKEEEAYANAFEGDATINLGALANGSTVGSIYACGARESRGEAKPDVFYHDANRYKVSGDVLVNLSGDIATYVDGATGGTANAAVCFSDAEDNMYINTLTLFHLSELSVNKGYLELSAESNLGGGTAISLAGGARLSLMKLGESITVGNFTGSMVQGTPGELEIETNQTLTVNGVVSGQTSVGVGGIAFPDLAEEGKTYISAPFALDLTGEEFVFLDYEGFESRTPIFAGNSNAWIAPGVDYTVVISEISVDAKTVIAAENTGVELPISISYSQRPDEYTGLAYVPVTIRVNGEEAIRDGSEEWGYTYAWNDLTIDAYMSYDDADELYEYLYIEGAAFTVPQGTYRFEMEVPAENMTDGQAEILSFTLVVGEEEIEEVLQPVDIPAAKTNLSYNGEEQIGVPEGEGYTLTGHKETHAGNYAAVATLEEGYKWSDETTEPKNISWEIGQASGVGSVTLKGWKEGEEANIPNVTSTTNDGDVSFLYKLQGADDSTYADFVQPPAKAGEYTLKAVFEETQNYTEVVAYADFTVVHAMNHVEEKKAACEQAGNEEYWYCSVCEKYYEDEDGARETTAEAIKVEATGHDWGAWNKVDDATHKRICKNNGNHTETEKHVYEEGVCVCGDEEEVAEGVEGFVTRLYQVCLERKPDASGLEFWTKKLADGTLDGTQVAYAFVFSDEFKEKNYCNEHYVMQLYLAFMGREYENAGLEFWLAQMNSGVSREEVFNGFAQSSEYKDICASYGIMVGETIPNPEYGTVPKGPCSVDGKEDGVTSFVKRLYLVCLEREAELDGLNFWREGLWNYTITGEQAARGFIFSMEFISKNYDDATYVEYLYRAFMGREAEAEGKAFWVNALSNQQMNRESVFNGFVDSKEFTDICHSYGIVKNEKWSSKK